MLDRVIVQNTIGTIVQVSETNIYYDYLVFTETGYYAAKENEIKLTANVIRLK